MEFSLPDILIFFSSTILMALLLMDLLEWSQALSINDNPTQGKPSVFAYGNEGGPDTWKNVYPEARGRHQSPINIIERAATVVTLPKSLRWCRYMDEPISMSLANNGNTVALHGSWPSPSLRPNLRGGPLDGVYDFHAITFRWGRCDDEGSEHTIDNVRYAMELQVLHTKQNQTQSGCKIAIVSYLFEISRTDNPYLDHVVRNLHHITSPGACVTIPAFPLEWIIPTFEENYYAYIGSLTHPPCNENVNWIVLPEPLTISASQTAQFRKICSMEGPILSNCRPVQKKYDRDILFYL